MIRTLCLGRWANTLPCFVSRRFYRKFRHIPVINCPVWASTAVALVKASNKKVLVSCRRKHERA